MIKTKRYLIIVAIMIFTLLLGVNWAPPAFANKVGLTAPLATEMNFAQLDGGSGVTASKKQQKEIKSVIQEYFDIHYQALSTSPPEDFQETGFGDLVSDGPEAKDFLVTEMGKLAVERKHYEIKKLRYAEHKYSLNYLSIIVDDSSEMADVSLYDIFEVIQEDPLKPTQ